MRELAVQDVGTDYVFALATASLYGTDLLLAAGVDEMARTRDRRQVNRLVSLSMAFW